MKEITVENFNYSNVKTWIADYSHKEKVEFAIYCAELVIDLYTGSSNAPKKAIQAAKDWVLNPSKENKQKCKDAYAAYANDAAAAADAAYAAADAAYAAADAAYAAAYAAAAYADAYAYAAAYAAAAYADAYAYADAAAAAAAYADAADAIKPIKCKIINYIINKLTQQTKVVDWVNGLPPVGVECECLLDCSGMWKSCEILFSSKSSVVVVKLKSGAELAIDPSASSFRKPETEADKIEREELEAAYDLYCEWHNLLGHDSIMCISTFKEDDNYALFRFFIASKKNLI